MRFLRSTATFRADAFFETSPMAIAATQPDSIQEEAALKSKDPSLSGSGPPHSLLDAWERMLPGSIRAAGTSRQQQFALWRKKCSETLDTVEHAICFYYYSYTLRSALSLSLSLSAYFLASSWRHVKLSCRPNMTHHLSGPHPFPALKHGFIYCA